MAWSNSKIFANYIGDIANNTTAIDCNSDTFWIALYGNTGTPDNTVTSANSAYNAGQWTSTNEITATGWTAGGIALASVAATVTSNVFTFTAAAKSGGATDTVTAAYGCLIVDHTITTPVTQQGLCYNYFGGSNSVAAGTFTVTPSGSGLFALTL